MSMQFSSVDDARLFALAMAGVDPKTVILTEDETLRVRSVASLFFDVDDPDASRAEEAKKAVAQDVEGQKGWRLFNANGVEIGIVVAPFRNGYCVWVVSLQTGAAIRL